jgi:hypothetical protein
MRMDGACCGGWSDPFRLNAIHGTNREDTRSTAMTRDMDAPANELRDETSCAKRAVSVVTDPKVKSRQEKIAKDSNAKPLEIDNDLA